MNVIVMAKAPVPGRVKTRLCPPCTPLQAARVAASALSDTVSVVSAVDATAILALGGAAAEAGSHAEAVPVPARWRIVPQRGANLGERLAHALSGCESPALLIGMDTPQVTANLLTGAIRTLAGPDADAVLGPAADGGWWALGLRDTAYAAVLSRVPMSTPETGTLTLSALQAEGLRVRLLPELRDVDTAEDAYAVAALCPPHSSFARAVRRWIPA